MSGRSPARAAAARNPARVRFAFATPSARCFQSEAGSRLRQAPPTTSPVPPAPASPATSACIPTPRGVPPAHPRPPRRQPFSPTEFSRRSTALKTHNRCAHALRARQNSNFFKSHPHSMNPHFALRALREKCTGRAAPPLIGRPDLPGRRHRPRSLTSCVRLARRQRRFRTAFIVIARSVPCPRSASNDQLGTDPDPTGPNRTQRDLKRTQRDTFGTLKGPPFSRLPRPPKSRNLLY